MVVATSPKGINENVSVYHINHSTLQPLHITYLKQKCWICTIFLV